MAEWHAAEEEQAGGAECVESLKKVIEQLHIGITQLRDHYCTEGEEVHDILSNLLKKGQ